METLVDFASSSSPSVVSVGSPWSLGSAEPLDVRPVDDRNRFAGGLLASIELFVFLCFKLPNSGAASSPDASLDEGCWRSIAVVGFRFLFADPGLEPAADVDGIDYRSN